MTRLGAARATPDVSICIVNWNTVALLRECLVSIVRSDHQVALEIIVVDNASTDNSVPMVRSEFPLITLIANAQNVGFARANNQAFKVARGRYLLLLNSDTIVLGDALEEMVAFADRQPQAGIVGCRLLNPDGSLQPSCRTFPNLWIMFFRALRLDKLFPGNSLTGANYMSHWGHDTVRQVDVVQGSCMLVRREVLDSVGMMDERFFLYSEETDWCYRAKEKGWRVYFTPTAEIIHYGGQSSAQQSARMTVVYYQSLLSFFRKHHGCLAGFIARVLAVVETGSRLTYWAGLSLLFHQRREQAADKIGVYWPAFRWLLVGSTAEVA